MKKLFSSPGKLYHLEDAEGNSIPKAFAEIAHPVLVDVKYELKPSQEDEHVRSRYNFARRTPVLRRNRRFLLYH